MSENNNAGQAEAVKIPMWKKICYGSGASGHKPGCKACLLFQKNISNGKTVDIIKNKTYNNNNKYIKNIEYVVNIGDEYETY